MTDREALLRGLVKLGVEESRVVKWRIEDGNLVVLVDLGIKGIPKYVLPLDKLPELPPPDMSQTPPPVEDIERGEMHAEPPPRAKARRAKR